MTKAAVAISLEEPGWRRAGVSVARLRAAARLALALGLEHKKNAASETGSLTILLAGDERSRELNRRFRGKDYPTNVLSFPSVQNGSGYLGDVALALGVAAREARAGNKSIKDHVLHLTVHGVLHLLGYDHEKSGEARTMERVEIAILHKLGVGNPYSTRLRTEPDD